MKRAQHRRSARIATVAHDFGSPLNSSRSIADVLAARLLDTVKSGALLVAVAAATLLPLDAYSTNREVVGTITRLYSYTQFGGGDVVVEFSNVPTQCAQGFWLSASDGGAKNSYALLLSAYHTQAAVRIVAEDTQMWPGSSTSICRILAAALD